MKILIALLLTISTALATPRYWGVDHLGAGAPAYRERIVELHPDGMAAGIFTQKELFGDGFATADKLLSSKKRTPLVRYSLRWSDTHSFSVRDFATIENEARRGLPVINKFPQVECEVSGATEHQLNQRDAEALAEKILKIIPERCTYVNQPWEGKGAFIKPGPRRKNEVHGGKAQPPRIGGAFNFSFDGTDAFDVDVTAIKNRMTNADVFFFWTSQNNLRRNSADATPRPQRTFVPVPKLMEALAFLKNDQGQVRLPPMHDTKPKSDQHVNPPAPRELKPVFIFPVKSGKITIRANGKSYQSTPAQPFADGRSRFYFAERYGYEYVLDAGTNVFDVLVNGKKIGTTNPAFRQGTYR